jgi:DNA (cytosine-5)-methyltransferase 1
MRIGSLFSGIGGLDIGLEQATGGRVVWMCENDPYARRVLARHFPDMPCYDDVRDVDEGAPAVDLVCGGFPCQDVSAAGSGAGIRGSRSGLWSEFARVVRVLRPGLVFVENVPGLASRGLGVVLGDLAALGYDAEWDCIGACCVGAPHRRLRLFILAADSERDIVRDLAKWAAPGRLNVSRGREAVLGDDGAKGDVADADGRGRESLRLSEPARLEGACRSEPYGRGEDGEFDVAAAAARPDIVRERCAGWPRKEEAAREARLVVAQGADAWRLEPDVGRVAHGVAARVDRLRSLGNAVVPAQVAKAWEILIRRIA